MMDFYERAFRPQRTFKDYFLLVVSALVILDCVVPYYTFPESPEGVIVAYLLGAFAITAIAIVKLVA